VITSRRVGRERAAALKVQAQPSTQQPNQHFLTNNTFDITTMDTLDQIPKPVLSALAGIGALFLGLKVFNYVRLLLSLFVLSGKNVSFNHHRITAHN
jgi:hypothetical protein